jgi:hypothetical protein
MVWVEKRGTCLPGWQEQPPLSLPPRKVPFRSPSEPRQLLMKRIIGLENDWVADSKSHTIEKVPKVGILLPQ